MITNPERVSIYLDHPIIETLGSANGPEVHRNLSEILESLKINLNTSNPDPHFRVRQSQFDSKNFFKFRFDLSIEQERTLAPEFYHILF